MFKVSQTSRQTEERLQHTAGCQACRHEEKQTRRKRFLKFWKSSGSKRCSEQRADQKTGIVLVDIISGKVPRPVEMPFFPLSASDVHVVFWEGGVIMPLKITKLPPALKINRDEDMCILIYPEIKCRKEPSFNFGVTMIQTERSVKEAYTNNHKPSPLMTTFTYLKWYVVVYGQFNRVATVLRPFMQYIWARFPD